jgi:YidC/Oxa1 family membrane protein insertase
MYDFIATILAWFYSVTNSYAASIGLLTIVIMTLLAPLTVRQTRSMLAQQRLAPEVKRLRTKYGADRERLNQEIMALYQANGVNPLGGCLPLLVQLPVFLVLYRVLSGLTRRFSDAGVHVGAFGANIEVPERVFNPDHLDSSTELYQSLSGSTEMNSLGIDFADTTRDVLSESLTRAIPYVILVLVVGFLTWYQQRQISQRQKGGPASELPAQQQALLKVLPYMLTVSSFFFPAGLVFYYFVSSLFRVGQQAFITRRVYNQQKHDAEIVRPGGAADNAEDDDEPVAAAPASSTTHGSRRPVANPPRKRTTTSARTTPRSTAPSKRVTPKQRPAAAPVTPPVVEGRKKKKG